jgi:Zn-dependent protease with chaperone function
MPDRPAPCLAYPPPSAFARALLSFVLLVGFYLVILGFAALLFVFGIAVVYGSLKAGRISLQILFVSVIFMIPAVLLVTSLFGTRRPTFSPPGRRLEPAEAPALFAIIDDLAARGGTSPPADVYLTPFPDLAVTEVGRLFRTRRVMIVGAPLLQLLTVDELRAGIAHELGHFIGGDTRLTTFTAQTHALFASVVTTVARDPFRTGTTHFAIEGGLAFAEALGRMLVGGYGRLFLRIMRPLGRRQERAADSLSAELVGGRTTARALEKIAIRAPLYERYLEMDVGFAVGKGAMPSDLSAGFARALEINLASEEGRRFVEAVRTRLTDPYDTHPSLYDRLLALEGSVDPAGDRDNRLAASLFDDAAALEGWLAEATRDRVVQAYVLEGRTLPALRVLSWSAVPDEVYAPAAREAARRLAERLHPMFPKATTMASMFASVWGALETGKMVEIALRLHPGLASMPRAEGERGAVRLSGEALSVLLQGALIERGAVFEDSLGASSLVLRYEEERVVPAELLRLLAQDLPAGRTALDAWVKRLAPASAIP